MQELVALLIDKQLRIASIESLTAGLFASSIASVPNASKVLVGSLVTYTNDCKIKLLHMDEAIIQTHGVISSECVSAMATQGQSMFNSDIVVSFSGNAGPSVMEDKEVGLVYMALLYKGNIKVFKEQFHGNRNEVRLASVNYMCEQIKLAL